MSDRTERLHSQEFVVSIAIPIVTSPIVINVTTGGLLAVETKDSIDLWLAKFTL